MGTKTGISWTDATWNPIRGCSRVSEGCRNCYAERRAYRFSGPGLAYEGLVQIGADGSRRPQWNGEIRFVEEHLLDPLKWKNPRRIFVNSMSDLFHENVNDEMRDRIFAVMALCPQHTFQVLTKRPERMLTYTSGHGNSHRRNIPVYNAAVEICAGDFSRMSQEMGRHRSSGEGWWPLQNVWLGVSVENQKTADERIPLLLQTPAAVRFISAEPLLGLVSLSPPADEVYQLLSNWYGPNGFDPTGSQPTVTRRDNYIAKVDWVIVGGESGPAARPMHPGWARSLRDQCKAAGVPFFFKQWGGWKADREAPDATEWKCGQALVTTYCGDIRGLESLSDCSTVLMSRVGTKAAGCLLDGVEHHDFPVVGA
jgi:protein gp37